MNWTVAQIKSSIVLMSRRLSYILKASRLSSRWIDQDTFLEAFETATQVLYTISPQFDLRFLTPYAGKWAEQYIFFYDNIKGLLNYNFLSSETFSDYNSPWRVKPGKIVIFAPHDASLVMGRAT